MGKSIINHFVAREYLSVAALLFFAILDAFFTFTHLANGAVEINPLLAYTLKHWGVRGMFWVKFSITLPCCLILLTYIRLPLAQKGIHVLLGAYGFVTLYHVWGFQIAY